MNIHLSKNIKHLRSKANLSLEELGRKINLSPGAINNLERSRNMPSLTVLIAMVEFFQINLHDLVFNDISEAGAKVEDISTAYGGGNRIAVRMEQMLSDLENRVKTECPDCARKLKLI